MSSGGYPVGTEYDPSAPWNEPATTKIPVTIEVIYTREVLIDIVPGANNNDIKEAALSQIVTPKTLLITTANASKLDNLVHEANNWDEESVIVN